MSFSVCVFCGSRVGIHEYYAAAAQEFGRELASRGWRLVYGGGSVGLMGALGRSVLAAQGNVTGVIPQALLDAEVALREANQLEITNTLRERKALMDAYSHAFVALPGGFGTFEELIEMLTLRQLGYHDKPIIIVNLHQYYDPLLALFEHAAAQGFVRPEQMQLFVAVPDIASAVALLEEHARHL